MIESLEQAGGEEQGGEGGPGFLHWGDLLHDVFDLRGQRVASLVRETQDPGSYSVPFGPGVATVDGGRVGALGPGVYFYRFRAGMFESTRRMLLTR